MSIRATRVSLGYSVQEIDNLKFDKVSKMKLILQLNF